MDCKMDPPPASVRWSAWLGRAVLGSSLERLVGNKAPAATIAVVAIDELLQGLRAQLLGLDVADPQVREVSLARVLAGCGHPCLVDE